MSYSTTIINHFGFELECEFDFTPHEPATSSHPGWPAKVQLIKASVNGVDITKMTETSISIEQTIEEQILEQMAEFA